MGAARLMGAGGLSTSPSSTRLPHRVRLSKISGDMRGRAASLPTGSGSRRGGASGSGTSLATASGTVGATVSEEGAGTGGSGAGASVAVTVCGAGGGEVFAAGKVGGLVWTDVSGDGVGLEGAAIVGTTG